MCSLFVLLKTKNFCIILCNVKVSIYACTMCGNKDINRRILLTLNCIICGNICVLSLKTKNVCIIMCKNSQLDRVIPKGNRKIKFLTPYVPILSFIMVRFKQLIKIKTRDTCKIFRKNKSFIIIIIIIFSYVGLSPRQGMHIMP